DTVLRYELPVVLHAEPRPGRHRHAAVLAYRFELIGVAAFVDRRHRVRTVWPDQRHLVVVAVAHGRHAVAVRRPAGVYLRVQPERLRQVCDLHCTGNAHVVLRIHAHEVGSAGDDEVGLGFDATDMLSLQQRRVEHLTQFFVGKGRDTAVPERVLVPEVLRLVAGAPD